MRVSGSGFPWSFGFSQFRIAREEAPLAQRSSARDSRALRDFAAMIVGLRSSVDALGVSGAKLSARTSALELVELTSASGLGLSIQETRTTLRSMEEVNATPTSFTPFGPSFSGASTTVPTIGGVYDGSQGDDVLTFDVRRAGTVGQNRVRIDVFDGGGNRIDRLIFRGSYVPDTPVSLSNGLTLSLSAGQAFRPDGFQVQVSSSQGSSVDPNLPFDGTRNQNPNFELGLGISAGSFDVNGVSIGVQAGDTLTTLLQRITDSSAGVSASFDAATESVVLTQKGFGSEPIDLANDTSGFFAAAKLDSATPVVGEDDQRDEPIEDVPALSSISSGFFQINQFAISVDVAQDSLNDVIDRINASGAPVVASYDPVAGRFVLNGQEELRLSDGTSGFLGGVNIAPGTYAPDERRAQSVFREPERIRKQLFSIASDLRGVFSKSFEGVAGRSSGVAREVFESGVRAAFDERFGSTPGPVLRTGMGLSFFFDGSSTDVIEVDQAALQRAMRDDPAGLVEFLFGNSDDEDDNGLIGVLAERTESIAKSLVPALEAQGIGSLFMDLSA